MMSDESVVTPEPEVPAAVDPAATAQAEPAADAVETKAPETQDDGDDGDGEKRKGRSGWQRAQRQIHELNERNARLERMVESLVAKPPAGAEDKADGEPKPDDFTTVDAYVKAVVDHRVKQALPVAAEQISARTQEVAARTAYETRANAVRENTPDFDDVLGSAPPVPSVVAQAILTDENGPKIAYALARNPEIIHAMGNLSPAQQLVKLGMFAAQALADKPKLTKAPPPARPVGSGAPVASRSAAIDRATTIDGIRSALSK